MSLQVDVAWIGALSALGGALLGAIASLLGGHLQHRREVRQQTQRERRAREVVAAERCGELFRNLCNKAAKRELFLYFVTITPEARVARDLYRETQLAIAQLPGDLADRVIEALVYLENARTLGRIDESGPHVIRDREYHYASSDEIISEISDEVTALLVAFIKGYDLPAPSDFFLELEGAWVDLKDHLADWNTEEYQVYQRKRQRFLEQNPGVREKIEAKERAGMSLPDRLKARWYWLRKSQGKATPQRPPADS